jgi:hypothetical protein
MRGASFTQILTPEWNHHDEDDRPARAQRAVRPYLHPRGTRHTRPASAHRHLPRPPGRPAIILGLHWGTLPLSATPGDASPRPSSTTSLSSRSWPGSCSAARARLTLCSKSRSSTTRNAERASSPIPASGTGPPRRPVPEAALEASAVADPRTTVKANVERLPKYSGRGLHVEQTLGQTEYTPSQYTSLPIFLGPRTCLASGCVTADSGSANRLLPFP